MCENFKKKIIVESETPGNIVSNIPTSFHEIPCSGVRGVALTNTGLTDWQMDGWTDIKKHYTPHEVELGTLNTWHKLREPVAIWLNTKLCFYLQSWQVGFN